MASDVPEAGQTFTHARTFTVADVREFGDLTGDDQPIHADPDEEGRLVVQGLLTGSLLTAIGGDLGLLAREMSFEFLRPVRTGERITCEWTVDDRTEEPDRYLLENSATFTDEDGEIVAEATTSGLIWK